MSKKKLYNKGDSQREPVYKIKSIYAEANKMSERENVSITVKELKEYARRRNSRTN